MERIRTLTSTLIATLLCFTSIDVEAKVLSCEATEGNGRGWIPREFRIDLANDRKTAQVISPITEVFGAKPFKKSFLGSSLWSRGKGKSDKGDYYNYQLQLDLDSNDTEARIRMTMQGYRDNELQFRCVTGGSNQLVASDSATAQAREKVPLYVSQTSDASICSLGTMTSSSRIVVWNSRSNLSEIVTEAMRRGLDCGVE